MSATVTQGLDQSISRPTNLLFSLKTFGAAATNQECYGFMQSSVSVITSITEMGFDFVLIYYRWVLGANGFREMVSIYSAI